MQRPNSDLTSANESQSAIAGYRIQRLSLHLTPPNYADDDRPHHQLQELECAKEAAKLNVDTPSLSNYMRGKHMEFQDRVLDYNKSPDLQTSVEILKDDHRELCMQQLVRLVREAGVWPFRYIMEDPAKYFVILEAIGSVNMSLEIKMGVQHRLK